MATAVHSSTPHDLDSGPSAQSVGRVPFGSSDFPLLPLGQLLWTDAAANVVELAEVAPRLPDCLITLTGAGRHAAVLVAGGAIVDAVFVDRSGGRLGDDAVQAVLSSTAGTVSGYAIEDARLVAAIPLLWRYPRPVRDLPAEWLDADRLLRSIRADRRSCALLLDSPVRAAALFAGGELVASYTEKRRRPSSTTATLRALLRVPGTRITVVAQAEGLADRATLDGGHPNLTPTTTAEDDPETAMAISPAADAEASTADPEATGAESDTIAVDPAVSETAVAEEPGGLTAEASEAEPEAEIPEAPKAQVEQESHALVAEEPEAQVDQAEAHVEQPEAETMPLDQAETAHPEPMESPAAESAEPEQPHATLADGSAEQITAFDEFAVVDAWHAAPLETEDPAADTTPTVDDEPELPFAALAEPPPAPLVEQGDAEVDGALSSPAGPPALESAPPAPDAPSGPEHIEVAPPAFGPPAHHLPPYVPPTFAGDHVAANGSSNGSNGSSVNGTAPAESGSESTRARLSPTEFLTEADELDAIVSDRLLERFPPDVFALPEMVATTDAPESSVPPADAAPMTADPVAPEAGEREIYRVAPPPPPAPDDGDDAAGNAAASEEDALHVNGEPPVAVEPDAAPDEAPLPPMPFDDGLTFHTIPPPAASAATEPLTFTPAANGAVPASAPEATAPTTTHAADPAPPAADHAAPDAHVLPEQADDFVPARLDIDIDGLRTELIDIATVWLGADDIAPVAELIQRARPGVDEFVATIAAIGALQIPGHEAAVVRAMAREMHFRAAEVLCGV